MVRGLFDTSPEEMTRIFKDLGCTILPEDDWRTEWNHGQETRYLFPNRHDVMAFFFDPKKERSAFFVFHTDTQEISVGYAVNEVYRDPTKIFHAVPVAKARLYPGLPNATPRPPLLSPAQTQKHFQTAAAQIGLPSNVPPPPILTRAIAQPLVQATTQIGMAPKDLSDSSMPRYYTKPSKNTPVSFMKRYPLGEGLDMLQRRCNRLLPDVSQPTKPEDRFRWVDLRPLCG